MMMRLSLQERLVAESDAAAGALRQAFAEAGVLCVNIISSPGSGKTSLLEALAGPLGERFRLFALVGDIETELDAARLRDAGMPAEQILTAGGCHLDARMIRDRLAEAPPCDILFIENVGNLICPAAYDLGEDMKVALLSVVEGDDKPFKYPGIFARAAITVISKVDLLSHTDFRRKRVRERIGILAPEAVVVEVSAKLGSGIEELAAIIARRAEAKSHAAEGGQESARGGPSQRHAET